MRGRVGIFIPLCDFNALYYKVEILPLGCKLNRVALIVNTLTGVKFFSHSSIRIQPKYLVEIALERRIQFFNLLS